MSAPRIGGAEGMDVDEAGVATPTNEWMEAAQRAVDTDGILENGSAKRQKVCNSCNTLTALHLQTLHKNAHVGAQADRSEARATFAVHGTNKQQKHLLRTKTTNSDILTCAKADSTYDDFSLGTSERSVSVALAQ